MSAIPSPLSDDEVLGKHENGFHIGAFILNFLALIFPLYLLVIHQDDLSFPALNMLPAFAAAIFGFIPLMAKYRTDRQGTVAAVLSFALAFLAIGIALATWYLHQL